MVNFGPRDTVPPQFEGRNLYVHNPTITLMRTTPSENAHLGRWMAEKLSRATGPTGIVIPSRGFSAYDTETGPFFDPAADAAFASALKAGLRSDITLMEIDAHINDPVFAEAAVTLYRSLAG